MGGVARGSSANLVGALVMATAAFVLTVVVTRGLPPATAGIFFAATSVFLLATTVGQLGTNTALVYFLSRLRALGRTSEIGAHYRTAIRPVAVVAALMAVILFLAAEPLGEIVVPGHAKETAEYLRLLAIFIPFAGWENVTLAGTRGLGTMRPSVVAEQLLRPLLQLAAVTAVVLLVPTPGALALAWAGPYLPAAVLGFAWWRALAARAATGTESADARTRLPHVGLHRHRLDRPARRGPGRRAGRGPGRGHPGRHRRASSTSREFWWFTGPRALASVGQIAMQRFDIVLVAALAGPAQAAVYTAATRFLVVGQMGNRAISTAVQPRLGETLARGDVGATNHYYRTSTAWLVAVTWPLYLTFVVFGEVLLRIFGSSYRAGGSVLVVLALTMLVATGCGMVDMVLNMAGKTSWNLWNVMLSVGVHLSLCLLLIPPLGILGAAYAWAAAILTSNLVPLLQIGLAFRIHPFGRAPLSAAGLALACYLGVGFAGRAILGPTVTGLVGTLVVASAGYLTGLWLLRGPLELAALGQIRRRRRGITSTAAAPAASAPNGR